ncbi:MAG: low molecular weight phosphotyrosine protein phosphatase [Erythrobacter sp.]|nr:low molecular weight phosphotyrosine protein phosphatase [Erythrobacter sp.]
MNQRVDTKLAVLFVCLGNICRSPMAEGAFRKAAAEAGLSCEVESVGTAAYHIGETPDPRAIATAKAHGVDISWALGRQLEPADFDRFSHIFALDKANLAGIMAKAPRDARAKVSLLMDVVPGREGEPVADPYYGDESDFEKAWDEISVAVSLLVKKLKNDAV